MSERVWGLAIYWGVWLILPVLVDGLTTLVQLVLVVLRRWQARRQRPLPTDVAYRGISIVIPVYNGEATLGGCLESLRQQRYPQELLQVIVVDNGSTDRTRDVFEAQRQKPFRGQMHWISIAGRGKAYALNAGFHLASYPYLCNIDADTVIHPDALYEMVRHFEANPRLGAATGAIEVLPADPNAGTQPFLIAECEFQEYLVAFWLGRQGQTLNDSLFTLAGAFSFFRREVLLKTELYDKQTVSEDTDVTFDVRKRFGGERLACIPEAIVYVTPTPSWRALYAQRVRWQRGQIEVAAVHQDLLDTSLLRLRGLALGRTLLIDHTFLFPRLTWSFLFPALIALGYPLSLVVGAMLIIYLFYVLIAAVSTVAVYLIATDEIRRRLRANWWITLLMPAYRMLTFVYRLAGSIIALAEPAEWRVRDPWSETVNALSSFWRTAMRNLPFRRAR